MPIVVVHQNNRQLGDLAQNAGNFATGQVEYQDALHQQSLDQQYALAQQQHGLEQQHINSDTMLHMAALQQTGQFQALRAALARAQLDSRNANFEAGLEHQYSRDQGNWSQQDQNRQSREGIAGDRNDLGYYRTDAQSTTAHDRMDRNDAYHQQLYDVANRRLGDYEQRIAQQASGGNAAASVALRQQIEQRVAGNQEVQKTRMYLQNLLATETHLQSQLDPFKNPDLDETAANELQHQLAANRAEQRRVGSAYKNMMLSATGTPAPATTQPTVPPPVPAPGIGAGFNPVMPPPANLGSSAAWNTSTVPPMTATNPQTGERMVIDPTTNQWVPLR